MTEEGVRLVGFDQLDRKLQTMPHRAAGNLQAVLRANANDFKREVGRTLGFDAAANRRVLQSIKIEPPGRQDVQRIEDVGVRIVNRWLGDTADVRKGVARRVEKTLGVRRITGRGGERLAIPVGPKGSGARALVTPGTDRPRRQGRGGPFKKVSDEKGTFVLPGKNGRDLVFRRKRPPGRPPAGGKRRKRRAKGTPPPKVELIGVLVRSAPTVRGLDWVGSWARLESKRQGRYRSLLQDVARGTLRNVGGRR